MKKITCKIKIDGYKSIDVYFEEDDSIETSIAQAAQELADDEGECSGVYTYGLADEIEAQLLQQKESIESQLNKIKLKKRKLKIEKKFSRCEFSGRLEIYYDLIDIDSAELVNSAISVLSLMRSAADEGYTF